MVLGRQGIERVLPLGPLSTFERAAMAKMMPELKASIEKGIQFANK
jgi:malate/lactate dehydrogenase